MLGQMVAFPKPSQDAPPLPITHLPGNQAFLSSQPDPLLCPRTSLSYPEPQHPEHLEILQKLEASQMSPSTCPPAYDNAAKWSLELWDKHSRQVGSCLHGVESQLPRQKAGRAEMLWGFSGFHSNDEMMRLHWLWRKQERGLRPPMVGNCAPFHLKVQCSTRHLL